MKALLWFSAICRLSVSGDKFKFYGDLCSFASGSQKIFVWREHHLVSRNYYYKRNIIIRDRNSLLNQLPRNVHVVNEFKLSDTTKTIGVQIYHLLIEPLCKKIHGYDN